MGGFLVAPVFEPIEPPLWNGAPGTVLTITSGGRRAWLPGGGGGGGGVGTYLLVSPAAGVYNDFDPTGFGTGVGRLDIDTTPGDVELTGLLAGTDAGLLIITNIGANNLILDPLNAASAAANRFRLPGQIYVSPQYEAMLLCYYGGTVNKWCMA